MSFSSCTCVGYEERAAIGETRDDGRLAGGGKIRGRSGQRALFLRSCFGVSGEMDVALMPWGYYPDGVTGSARFNVTPLARQRGCGQPGCCHGTVIIGGKAEWNQYSSVRSKTKGFCGCLLGRRWAEPAVLCYNWPGSAGIESDHGSTGEPLPCICESIILTSCGTNFAWNR